MITLTAREAEVVAALVEAAVQPGQDLPPVRDTDAVAAFAALLAAAPATNRLALRAAVHLADLLPWARGCRARLRDLPVATRDAVLDPRNGPVGLVERLAASCYYGDIEVMRRLGFDADAIVRRGAAARAARS